MVVAKQNIFSAHDVTLLMPTPGQETLFGWIRLTEGDEDAGYIYLVSPPVKPRLSSRVTYIVTSVSPDFLQPLLQILRDETDLQIRFDDPEVEGIMPSVFIEARAGEGVQNQGFHAAEEVAKELDELRERTAPR